MCQKICEINLICDICAQCSHWVEERIWPIRIEDFVAVHHCDEVFGVTEVDDVVGVTREHVNSLDVVTIYFPF